MATDSQPIWYKSTCNHAPFYSWISIAIQTVFQGDDTNLFHSMDYKITIPGPLVLGSQEKTDCRTANKARRHRSRDAFGRAASSKPQASSIEEVL